MKSRLLSILLMCVFAFPAMVQAAEIDISKPLYQADVTSAVIGIGKNAPVAMAAANSADTINHNAKLKPFNMCTELTQPEETIININQCAACYSTAENVIGVPGGNSIGIRQNS